MHDTMNKNDFWFNFSFFRKQVVGSQEYYSKLADRRCVNGSSESNSPVSSQKTRLAPYVAVCLLCAVPVIVAAAVNAPWLAPAALCSAAATLVLSSVVFCLQSNKSKASSTFEKSVGKDQASPYYSECPKDVILY